jgi:pimeloyl-ACP methyl ester carboxylesterase
MANDIENRQVSWKVLGIDVYGTLTAPKDGGVHPAVVFVAGSGPTDRDWCSPLLPGSNGSAKLLAEALAQRGFVTLRYDKIGSGPHVMENVPKLIGKLSMQSHLEELSGAVDTLLAQPNVDGSCLFALASSEGCIHAVNCHLQSRRFRGIVLTGAPGRSIGEVSRSQIRAQVQMLPNADAVMKSYDDAIAAFVSAQPLPDTPLLEGGIKMLILSLYSPANLPFARELWSYSLPENLAKVEVPVLVLIGKKDIQVNWREDGCELQKATAQNPAVTFVFPENANHVLKYEPAPLEQLNAQEATARYNAPDAVLDGEAAEVIYGWLKEQGSVGFAGKLT